LGDFASNRAYRAVWVQEKQGTALQLSFSEHENSPAGLHVEKTLRLTAPETVEAAYRVSLGPAAPGAPEDDRGPKQSFISMLSVPASASEEESTYFCWQSAVSSASDSTPNAKAKSESSTHCEDFVASGGQIAIPAEIARLEIQTTGRSTLTVEWTSAQAIIVPKIFSAEIKFALPAPPGAPPVEFTLRYTVGESGP